MRGKFKKCKFMKLKFTQLMNISNSHIQNINEYLQVI